MNPDHDTANLHVEIFGRRRLIPLPVRLGPATPTDLLPAARALADGLSAAAVEHAREAGRAVSCRAACGACCRQAVGISALEAAGLAITVENLPEPRRSGIRRRFDDAVARLEAAGLLDPAAPKGTRTLIAPDAGDPKATHRAAAKAYFALGIPCPFLENESCSIYPERPMMCREYNVTSPPELCSRVYDAPVEKVAPPQALCKPLARTAAPLAGTAPITFPLTLALEWAEAHAAGFARTHDGAEMFRSLLGELDRDHATDFDDRE